MGSSRLDKYGKVLYSYQEDVEKHGAQEALILYNLKHGVDHNKELKRQCFKGFYWYYISIRELSRLLPCLSKWQVENAIKKLIASKTIITDNFNKASYDKTRWFSIPGLGEVDETCPGIQTGETDNASGNQDRLSGNQDETCPGIQTTIPDSTLQIINSNIKLFKSASSKVISSNIIDSFNEYERLGIRSHQKTDRNIDKVEKRLKKAQEHYSFPDILFAMKNYKTALEAKPDLYVWDLWEFLGHEKAEKYYPDNFNPSNFISSKVKKVVNMLNTNDAVMEDFLKSNRGVNDEK